jgi:hypothetical protein
MATFGRVKVAHRIVTATIYRLFRLIFCAIQKIVWELNGTAAHLRKVRNNPDLYDQSAQVVDIVMYHAFCELASTKPRDYIYTHNRFVSPQYVVENDHVTLFGLDDNVAVFVEAEKKGSLKLR